MENFSLIIGIPTESIWSTSTEFVHKEIKLSVSLTIHTQLGDASTVGRTLLHDIQSWVETNPTIEIALKFFSRYTFPDSCEVVIWYQRENQSLFAVQNGVVGVKRQGKFFEIVSLGAEFQCVRGELSPDDILIFGTKQFATQILPSLALVSDPFTVATKYASGEKGILDPAVCGRIQRQSTLAENTPIIPEPRSEVVRRVEPKNHRPIVWLHFSTRRKKIFGSLVMIAVVIVSILMLQQFVLTLRQKRIAGVTAPLSSRLTQITASSDSRMEKEKKLFQLINDTAQAKTSHASDIAIQRELSGFEIKLQSEYQRTARRKELDHLSVFYDFRLITSDFVASQIQYDIPGRLAVFLDTARGKIVSLSLEKKQPQALSVNANIGKLQSLTVIDRKAYLLGTLGIYKVSLPLDTQGQVVASASAGWVSPERIGSFAKNIYVLDPGGRQIFRYDSDDFSASPSSWLRGKEGVDFDSITSLAIDGDVWMGTTQGKVYKFSRGDRSAFSFTDILNPPDTSIHLYTAELLPNLYVLEPRAKRIVIFDKSGNYVSSIVCPDLESATALVVSEDGEKAYVLAGSLVYEVEL